MDAGDAGIQEDSFPMSLKYRPNLFTTQVSSSKMSTLQSKVADLSKTSMLVKVKCVGLGYREKVARGKPKDWFRHGPLWATSAPHTLAT